MTDFITTVEGWFVTTEAQVQQLILEIQQGAPAASSAINSAIKWVVSETPTIASDVQLVEGWITTLGFSNNTNVAAAIKAANLAVAALNAFAASEAAGQSNVQSVISGYVAVKQAAASVASAAAAVAQIPAKS